MLRKIAVSALFASILVCLISVTGDYVFKYMQHQKELKPVGELRIDPCFSVGGCTPKPDNSPFVTSFAAELLIVVAMTFLFMRLMKAKSSRALIAGIANSAFLITILVIFELLNRSIDGNKLIVPWYGMMLVGFSLVTLQFLPKQRA